MTEHERLKSNPLEQDVSGRNVTKFVPRSQQGRRNREETASGHTMPPAVHTPFDDDDDPGPTAA